MKHISKKNVKIGVVGGNSGRGMTIKGTISTKHGTVKVKSIETRLCELLRIFSYW